MQNTIPSQLSDSELVGALAALASTERRTTVALIAHLAEMEARQLYLGAGYPSMFVYCVQVLRLSEGGAYNRIEAARLARAFPIVLDSLEEGLLNLASLRLLAPHLRTESHAELLAAAARKSKREVQVLLARMFPRPDVATSIRRLPDRTSDGNEPEPGVVSVPALPDPPSSLIFGDPTPGGDRAQRTAGERADICDSAAAPVARPAPSALPRHPLVTPLSADRYQIRFTASGSLCEKLKRAQDLLRHAIPGGEPAEIFDRALTALLTELDRKKFAATDRPRAGRAPAAGSRTIPAAVKRSVTARDEGRCAFVARSGVRCGTRAFLEFHHLVPYARGGPATADNIQVRCRAHNGYEADVDFGTGNTFGRRKDRERTEALGRSVGLGGSGLETAGVSAGLSTRPGTSWLRAFAMTCGPTIVPTRSCRLSRSVTRPRTLRDATRRTT